MNHLWPLTATFDEGDLRIGGASVAQLAAQYGTPLYIYDEATLRERARQYRCELAARYPTSSQVAYASKAYLSAPLAALFADEELDLDVVSGGELAVALAGGFPPGRIHFHGNNKSPEELREALAAGVGRIVVDNFHELELLDRLATERGEVAEIWLRLAPGVQAHTHSHIQTGQEDTKFGFSIQHGQAADAVRRALAARGLKPVGLHAHIGSQIYEPESLAESAERLIDFAAEMRDRHGFQLRELSPGGGWGVPMIHGDAPAPLEPYVTSLAAAITARCNHHGLPLPHLVLEPGRSLVARAGVAVYTVGARKEIPGVRTYVSIDGGMADNIRPALYGASYTALALPERPGAPVEAVTIAGKYCESGDILIRDIPLPRLEPGDLLAIPMAGAYTLAMASNYNQARRPAALLVRDGRAQVMQRRETYDDLLARDTQPGRGGRFTKYEAAGNDYLVLDPRHWPEPPDAETARQICDRHRGIGADGALWGPIGRGPFGIRLFNPDGSEFEKSGNGLRIFAAYLWQQRIATTRDFDILTPAGPVTAHILDERGERVAMDMGQARFDAAALGLATDEPELIEAEVEVAGRDATITAVSMGNPHCVVFGMDGRRFSYAAELSEWAATFGPALETQPLYPNRTNVQFARVVDCHTIEIAIWERGAGYTLASGTSSCAAAAAAIRAGHCESPVTVRMPGGEMLVEVDANWNARLTGSACRVCAGEWFRKQPDESPE